MRTEFDNKSLIDTLSINDAIIKFAGKIENAKLVEEQTMHQVFRVEASEGIFYVKVGKPNDKDQGHREMQIEVQWYQKFKDKLKLTDAPEAIYAAQDGNHFAVIREVKGQTFQHLLNNADSNIEKISLLDDIIRLSAKIAVDGANLNRNEPGVHPVFFGGFNAGEAGFLNSRTKKNLLKGLTDEKYIQPIAAALDVAAKELTDPDNWLFYRDATPLNWIRSQNGTVVPVDLGSTSYRPVGLEIVALLETPNTNVDSLSEQIRSSLIENYRGACLRAAEQTGIEIQDADAFVALYNLSSFVKNASGIASRMIHIEDTIQKIKTTEGKEKDMFKQRLPANVAGRDFHIQRAYIAARQLVEADYQTDKLSPAYGVLEKMSDGGLLKEIKV